MIDFDHVQSIVAAEMGIPLAEIKPESSFVSLGVDSMEMAAMILEFEAQLDICIERGDEYKLLTAQDVVNYANSQRAVV